MRFFLLALVLSLAGCSGAPDGPADREPVEDPFAAPGAWAVGDWWRMTTSGGEQRRIVTGESGGDWIMDTDDADTAYFDALTDISTLGPQRKSDLAGSQGSDRVQFFRWPLREGDAWTTTWDDELVHITVTAIDRVAHLEAHADGALRVHYTYDPALRWFGAMTFMGDAQTFEMTITEAGHNATGEALRMSLAPYAQGEHSGPTGAQQTLPAPPASTDLFMAVNLTCTAGVHVFALGPVESGGSIVTGQAAPGYSSSGACPVTMQDAFVIAQEPYPDNWGLAVALPPDGHVAFTVTARTWVPVPL